MLGRGGGSRQGATRRRLLPPPPSSSSFSSSRLSAPPPLHASSSSSSSSVKLGHHTAHEQREGRAEVRRGQSVRTQVEPQMGFLGGANCVSGAPNVGRSRMQGNSWNFPMQHDTCERCAGRKRWLHLELPMKLTMCEECAEVRRGRHANALPGTLAWSPRGVRNM